MNEQACDNGGWRGVVATASLSTPFKRGSATIRNPVRDDRPEAAYSLGAGADFICCGCTRTGRERGSLEGAIEGRANRIGPARSGFQRLDLDQFRAPTIARQKPL